MSEVLNLDDVSYRGEGNNTIVLSHDKLGLVVRIRKRAKNTEGLGISEFNRGKPHFNEFFDHSRIFPYLNPYFLLPLNILNVDASFLTEAERKILSQRPADRIWKGIDHSVHQVLISTDATKLPSHLRSHAYGPVLSVEIKPKFGAIPQWPAMGAHYNLKNACSIFCLRQFHSSKLERWKRPSLYCPCDLFSGDRNRMIHALYALLVTPQINFRVFLNSGLIFSCDVSELESGLKQFFTEVPLEEASLSNSAGDSLAPTTVKKPSTECQSPVSNGASSFVSRAARNPRWLRSTSVPNVVRKFQLPMLDLHLSGQRVFKDEVEILLRGVLPDILLFNMPSASNHHCSSSAEDDQSRMNFIPSTPISLQCGLHPWSSKKHMNGYKSMALVDGDKLTMKSAENTSCRLPRDCILGRILSAQLVNPNDISHVMKDYKVVVRYLEEHNLTWDNYMKRAAQDPSISLGDAETTESFNAVVRYLTSMVARDCSLLVTLQRALPDCPPSVPTVGGYCSIPQMIFSASVIDLDPKPLYKVGERPPIEESIVRDFLSIHTIEKLL